MAGAGRDLGTYGTDSAKGLWGTAEEAGSNAYHGSGNVLSKGLEGIEYVGKGLGNTVGGSLEGFWSGFHHGKNNDEKDNIGRASPVPASLKHTAEMSQPPLETGSPNYGS